MAVAPKKADHSSIRLRLRLAGLAIAVAITAAFCGLAADSASARTLYVDRESRGGKCSDARRVSRVTSPRRPWCSLGRAVARAPAGSTVLVRGGRYPELGIVNRNRVRRVTFKRYRRERIRLAGIDIENSSRFRFRGFRITDWIDLNDGSRSISLVRNNISPHGIQMKNVNRILIERNRIHHLSPASEGKCGCGIWGQAWGDEAVRNVTVRGNRMVNLGGDGVHFGNGRNIKIIRNTIASAFHTGDGDHVDAIQIMETRRLLIAGNRIQGTQHGIVFTNESSSRIRIVNNVVAQVRNYGINAGHRIPHARIVNNTFWRNRHGAITVDGDSHVLFKNNVVGRQNSGDGAFAVHDYNLIAEGYVHGRHDRRGRARFVAPWRGNFRLRASSKGIDAGASDGAPRRDRFGKRRRDVRGVRNKGGGSPRYYDIGAHER